MVPRTSRLTLSPVRPSCVYFMVPANGLECAPGKGGWSVAGEFVGLEGETHDRAGEVQVIAEGHRGLDLVGAFFGLGVDVAPALVGVGDEVDRNFRLRVGGLLGAVVVGRGALGDDLGGELDVAV